MNYSRIIEDCFKRHLLCSLCIWFVCLIAYMASCKFSQELKVLSLSLNTKTSRWTNSQHTGQPYSLTASYAVCPEKCFFRRDWMIYGISLLIIYLENLSKRSACTNENTFNELVDKSFPDRNSCVLALRFIPNGWGKSLALFRFVFQRWWFFQATPWDNWVSARQHSVK